MSRMHLGSGDLSISQLEEILAGRRAKVAKYERQRKIIQRKLDAIDAKIVHLGGQAGGGSGGGRAHNAKSLPETIFAVLSRHGGPMKVPEIVKGCYATGYKSKSASFRGIVNQALIKDKRFTAASRGIYQLKK